jgi:hypothetical protein
MAGCFPPARWFTLARNHPENRFNREKNRDFFKFDHKIIEFCPKSANSASKQGIIREFCGYLSKSASTLDIVLLDAGFKELSGNSSLPHARVTPGWSVALQVRPGGKIPPDCVF